MANRYWVGGVNNWFATSRWASTKGGAGGSSLPSLSDDVYISEVGATYWAASTTYTLTQYSSALIGNGFVYECTTAGTSAATEPTWPTTAGATVTDGTVVWTCRSVTVTLSGTTYNCGALNFAGFIGTFNISARINARGNVTMNSNMTVSGSSVLELVPITSSTLISAGRTLPSINCTSGGTPIFGDNITAISFSRTSTGGLTLNGSVTLSGNWSYSSSAGTLTHNNNTVTVSGTSFAGGDKTYSDVVLNGAGTVAVTGTNTYANLTRTGTAVFTDAVTFSANQTITGTLTLTGSSAINRLYVASNTRGTPRTLTAAAVSLTNCDIEDITGAGAGAPFTGSSLGNCYGNSGITFTPAVNRYRIGSSSNWSDSANWSDTAGGSGGFSVPLPQDYAYLNASAQITVNMPRIGNSDWGLSSWVGNVAVNVYGDLIDPNTTGSLGTDIFLRGRGTHSIGGNISGRDLFIDSLTGTYTLTSNFVNTITVGTTGSLNLTSGILDLNGYNVTLSGAPFSISGSIARTVYLRTGTITLQGTGTAWNAGTTTNLTFDAGTSTIRYTNTSTTARTFAGGGQAYNNFEIGGAAGVSTVTITGTNTFNTISSTKTVAHTINLTSGTTTTVSNWTVNGTSGNLLTLKASTTSAATLAKAGGGTVTIDYANISYITGSPIDTWYATNSTNSGNNTNVYFITPPSLGNSSFLMMF